MKIISQGAEAIIKFHNNKVIKERIPKSYRLKELDEKLRRFRTKKESKLLEKAIKIIPVPKVISSSEDSKKITLEFIKGKKLSEHLDKIKNYEEVCLKIGQNIAKLHDSDIIHGDLTTSNMILKEDKVYFIDFGLGYESNKSEDKAVDLHLIKQALEAKHSLKFNKYFDAIKKGYSISKNYSQTFKRLENVEKRGRYKRAY